ncbi:MAG: hypothetical protein ACPF9F_04000 [Acholeplasmataceae bacterium]
MNQLKKLDRFIGIYTYIVFLLALWYTTWTLSGMSVDGSLLTGVTNQWYFTNQSNTLVVITVALFWARFDNKKWFKYLASITLVNIVITSTGYHFILAPDVVSFMSHLSHTIVPIAYVIWYFVSVRSVVPLKLFWINIIYPMTYLGLVLILRTFPLGTYPYGFLNVDELGLANVLQFTLTIMFPAYTVLALVFTYLKHVLEKKVFVKNE